MFAYCIRNMNLQILWDYFSYKRILLWNWWKWIEIVGGDMWIMGGGDLGLRKQHRLVKMGLISIYC